MSVDLEVAVALDVSIVVSVDLEVAVALDGTKEKFQSANWIEKLRNEKFRKRVLEIMDKELIYNFETKEGHASKYYNIDGDEETFDEVESAK